MCEAVRPYTNRSHVGMRIRSGKIGEAGTYANLFLSVAVSIRYCPPLWCIIVYTTADASKNPRPP
jgi:hypothetical protein